MNKELQSIYGYFMKSDLFSRYSSPKYKIEWVKCGANSWALVYYWEHKLIGPGLFRRSGGKIKADIGRKIAKVFVLSPSGIIELQGQDCAWLDIMELVGKV